MTTKKYKSGNLIIGFIVMILMSSLLAIYGVFKAIIGAIKLVFRPFRKETKANVVNNKPHKKNITIIDVNDSDYDIKDAPKENFHEDNDRKEIEYDKTN